ncbi:Sec-independent protein translocase protein TatC [Desulfovibrionales bacterium]
MTFVEHLSELRVNLVRCLVALLIGMFACYGYAPKLFAILQQPLKAVLPQQSTFIFTSLTEAFFVYMKVSLMASLFLTSPYLFYQLWHFIAPGLYPEERRFIIPVAICSALFFVSGALFGYYLVFPFAFSFFMGFATDIIKPMPSLDLYLNFCLKMLFAFGFVFELPIFILFLVRFDLVTVDQLKQARRYFIVVAFIVAAVLTPGPDVISQMLMAFPMIFLYEVSIVVTKLFCKKQLARTTDEESTKQDIAQTTHTQTVGSTKKPN